MVHEKEGGEQAPSNPDGNWWVGYLSTLFGLVSTLAISFAAAIPILLLYIFQAKIVGVAANAGFHIPLWAFDVVSAVLWIWVAFMFFFPMIVGLNKGGWKSMPSKTPNMIWALLKLHFRKTFLPFMKYESIDDR